MNSSHCRAGLHAHDAATILGHMAQAMHCGHIQQPASASWQGHELAKAGSCALESFNQPADAEVGTAAAIIPGGI